MVYIKKALILLFLVISGILKGIGKIVMKLAILPTYKACYLIRHRLGKRFGKYLAEDRLMGRLVFRHCAHLVIVILAIFVAVGSINARDKGFESEETVISSLISMRSQDEEVVEGAGSGQNAPLMTLAETEGFVRSIPKMDSGSDFRMAGSVENAEGDTIEITENIETVTLAEGYSAIMKPLFILTPESAARTEIEYYTVQPGDNPLLIAQKFGISVNTVLWENNLNNWSSRFIKPGQKLAILPVTGIKHTVRNGENLAAIAKKYKGDVEDIMEFNGLEDAGQISVGQSLVIPDGVKPYVAPVRTVSRTSSKSNAVPTGDYTSYYNWTKTGGCHKFYKGQCTSFVAYRWESERGQCVPRWGHAKTWLSGAIRDGYKTCVGRNCAPKVGSIIVIRESWYGHVGYVESVSGNKITFSEMNYYGPWKTSRRTFNKGYWKIIGYIY